MTSVSAPKHNGLHIQNRINTQNKKTYLHNNNPLFYNNILVHFLNKSNPPETSA